MTGIDEIVISYFNLWKENNDITDRENERANLELAIIDSYSGSVVNTSQIKALDTLQLSLQNGVPDGNEDNILYEQNEAQMLEYKPMLVELFLKIGMSAISYSFEDGSTMYMYLSEGAADIEIGDAAPIIVT